MTLLASIWRRNIGRRSVNARRSSWSSLEQYQAQVMDKDNGRDSLSCYLPLQWDMCWSSPLRREANAGGKMVEVTLAELQAFSARLMLFSFFYHVHLNLWVLFRMKGVKPFPH